MYAIRYTAECGPAYVGAGRYATIEDARAMARYYAVRLPCVEPGRRAVVTGVCVVKADGSAA
jgi:hypothetical protein